MFRSLPLAASASAAVLVDHNGTPSDPSDDVFLEDLGVIKPSTGTNGTEGRDFCEDFFIATS